MLGMSEQLRTEFIDAMAQYPSGVTIVTATDPDGAPVGFTASSFCSVSVDPPLVLVCLARTANCFPVFAVAESFAVSVLGAEQTELAFRFATKRPDKFAGDDFVTTAAGAVVVRDSPVRLECAVRSRVEAGDHTILVGAVEAVSQARHLRPAIYVDRGFIDTWS
ncbi:flavin reductase family protein [Nocardia sp. NPDC057353]|uniref:flavin reductase family protein n=1 Tax=Nocardia sp. NPDC057353 TaxID=3346104 RepID=UPI00362F6C0D